MPITRVRSPKVRVRSRKRQVQRQVSYPARACCSASAKRGKPKTGCSRSLSTRLANWPAVPMTTASVHSPPRRLAPRGRATSPPRASISCFRMLAARTERPCRRTRRCTDLGAMICTPRGSTWSSCSRRRAWAKSPHSSTKAVTKSRPGSPPR